MMWVKLHRTYLCRNLRNCSGPCLSDSPCSRTRSSIFFRESKSQLFQYSFWNRPTGRWKSLHGTLFHLGWAKERKSPFQIMTLITSMLSVGNWAYCHGKKKKGCGSEFTVDDSILFLLFLGCLWRKVPPRAAGAWLHNRHLSPFGTWRGGRRRQVQKKVTWMLRQLLWDVYFLFQTSIRGPWLHFCSESELLGVTEGLVAPPGTVLLVAPPVRITS